MERAAERSFNASFDVVGRYRQDIINGFGGDVIESLLDAVQPQSAERVLDAMAGDGNLSQALATYCDYHRIAMPQTTVLEYSQVQSEFARALLSDLGVQVVWGDVLSGKSLEDGTPLPEDYFDRVMMKSSNHEIAFSEQPRLYDTVLRTLRYGGTFANLGFLFDDAAERDEFRAIARVKDTLAKMHHAAEHRHFLTRDEFYALLREQGFVDIRAHRTVDYRIASEPVAKTYFAGEHQIAYDIEHQVAQVRAWTMRSRGRILFEGTTSTMLLPGEITIARKPTIAEQRTAQFTRYPYLFLRHIAAHREMLVAVQRYARPSDDVLDLGCGPGLLAERLDGQVRSYRGIDANELFIASCRERFGHNPRLDCSVGDLNEVDLPERRFSLVTLLNVLYIPGIDVVRLLQRALAALQEGGTLVVSGPLDEKSFERAAPEIERRLREEGVLPAQQEVFDEVCRVNAQLLSRRANYWSVEGMVQLLMSLGAGSVSEAHADFYHGNSYFIAVRR